MMKTKILILYFLFVWLGGKTIAQNFEPTDQVKSALSNRNTSVDHATGTFHYRIPLFELTSGQFKLPISLNYSTQGMKEKGQHLGDVGMGWNLDVGGIVTRTIRGGHPDEHGHNDGCDVFTVVFNGQSVRFVEDKPLEKTNVKIRSNRKGKVIFGWVITDENGVDYVYNEIETVGIKYGGPTTNKDLWDKKYTSSWYLTRIDIPNASSIYFDYDVGFQKNPETGKGLISTFSEFFPATYIYGHPIIEHTMGYGSPAENGLNHWLDKLKTFLDVAHQKALQEKRYNIDVNGTITVNPFWDASREQIRFSEQVIGILSDYAYMGESALQMMNFLYSLRNSFPYNSNGIYYTDNAISCIRDMLRETREVTQKDASTFQEYVTRSPVLVRIRCEDKILVINHVGNRGDDYGMSISDKSPGKMYDMQLRDYNNNLLKKVSFSSSNDFLKGVAWTDRGQDTLQSYRFTYYGNPWKSEMYDMWGYYSNVQDWSLGGRLPDEVNVKKNSLASVKSSTGMELRVDYELNTATRYDIDGKYGGMRVKSITARTPEGGLDSVAYRYPVPGVVVYDTLKLHEVLDYSFFRDCVLMISYQIPNNLVANTGNNGVYYPYVEEEIVGKGTNTYLFGAPSYTGEYSYWVHGLLLAQASYDKAGRLVHMAKNRYLCDKRLLSNDAMERDWLEDAPAEFLHQKIFDAMDHPYKIDAYAVEKQYLKMKEDVQHSGLSDYIDVDDLYKKDVEVRFGMNNSSLQCYIYYGGKTALRERKEYLFHGSQTTRPSQVHLTGALPAGATLVSDVRFEYENPGYSVLPTRVIEKRANGDERITCRYTAADFRDGCDPVIDKMKAENMFAPVIKEASYLKRNGKPAYHLLNETVNVYEELLSGNGSSVILPSRVLVYMGAGDSLLLPPVLGDDNRQTALLTRETGKYREMTNVTHETDSIFYYPTRQESLGKVKSSVFERLRPRVLVEADGCDPAELDAVDTYLQDHGNSEIRREGVYDKLLALSIFNRDVFPAIRERYAYMTSYYYSNEFDEFYESGRLDSLEKNLNEIARGFILLGEWDQTTPADPVDGYLKFMKAQEYLQQGGCDEFNYFRLLLKNDDENSSYFFEEIKPVVEEITWDWGWNYDFNYWHTWQDVNGIAPGTLYQGLPSLPVKPSLKKSLVVTPKAGTPGFKVSLLVKPAGTTLSVTSLVSRGASRESKVTNLTGLIPGTWQLVTFDVAGGTGVTSVEVLLPANVSFASAVIAPSHVPHVGYAYNPDGSLFCKFDQNGQLERYEYDAAGRLSKTFDRAGNLLGEKNHHVVVQ